MKRPLLLVVALLSPALAVAAGGATPTPTASSASASAATSPADPSLPPFGAALPTEDSKKPTTEEWRDAAEVRITRAGPRASGCHVYRVREWLRVSCPELVTASISVLGGTPTGFAFWIDPAKEGAGGKLPAGGEALFPLKKGDRRVVQMLTFGPGYEGPLTQLPALVIQAHWLDDASGPVLTLY